MKIAVLGGLGMQGKAALIDLARSGRVREIICADVSLKDWDRLAAIADVSKIKPAQVDGSSKKALLALFKQGFDAAIDLLPLAFMGRWLFGLPGLFGASAVANVLLALAGFLWLGRAVRA